MGRKPGARNERHVPWTVQPIWYPPATENRESLVFRRRSAFKARGAVRCSHKIRYHTFFAYSKAEMATNGKGGGAVDAAAVFPLSAIFSSCVCCDVLSPSKELVRVGYQESWTCRAAGPGNVWCLGKSRGPHRGAFCMHPLYAIFLNAVRFDGFV